MAKKLMKVHLFYGFYELKDIWAYNFPPEMPQLNTRGFWGSEFLFYPMLLLAHETKIQQKGLG